MQNIITPAELSAIAELSKLEIESDKAGELIKDLENMIKFAEQISEATVSEQSKETTRLFSLAELRDDVDPDYITVAYGTNDWSKNKKDVFDRDSRLFYENLSQAYPRAKIFAMSPVWRINCETRITDVGEFTYVARTLSEIASALPNVTFIDCIDFIPHDKDLYVQDVLHPNDGGFYHYAMNLAAEIKRHI